MTAIAKTLGYDMLHLFRKVGIFNVVEDSYGKKVLKR